MATKTSRMNCLALDTSTRVLSCALFSNSGRVRSRTFQLKTVVSDRIIPEIEKILQRGGIRLLDLDCLAVGLGPGSFTGLRVGCATVKGLALGLGCPVIGCGSLDILACQSFSKKWRAFTHVVTIQDARRQLVYAAAYERDESLPASIRRVWGPSLLSLADVLSRAPTGALWLGDAVGLYRKELTAWSSGQRAVLPDPKDVCHRVNVARARPLVEARYFSRQFDDVRTLVPFYLYPEDCQVTETVGKGDAGREKRVSGRKGC